jgi:hypothetical protein
LILVSLACNAPIGDPAESVTEEPNSAQVTAPVADNPAPGQEAPSTAEPLAEQPSDLAGEEAPSEPVAADVGLTFENPYPIGAAIETPYWDVQVLEFLRGEPARQRILQDKPDLESPPPGMEYVVLHLLLRNKFTDEFSKSLAIDELFIAGDRRLQRRDGLTDVPSPEIVYTDTYSAEELDAWHDALVAVDEGNLVLVLQPRDGTDEPPRYLALEEGAAPTPVPALAAIAPNDLGLDPANPAPFGQTVVAEDWEVTILEVMRGEPAAELFRELHEANEVDEGMVPTLVKLRVRYIGDGEYRPSIGSDKFAAAQDAERFTESPRRLMWNPYDPPWMDMQFMPGGQHEGWLMLQSPAGQEESIMLRFQPDAFDAVRYLALEP